MTSPNLPAELKAALDSRLQDLSRNDTAVRAAAISQTYRDGGGSGAIRSESDALAYALTRMPATYAAVTAGLDALHEIRPDFAPANLLDVGAGPGTATWAAAEVFSSLQRFALLDANDALRMLALSLVRDSARLKDISYGHGEGRTLLENAEAADLVVASYMIGEVSAAERTILAERMWKKTRDTLLVVEPGTPAGYARIIALRSQLIAAGAHVAAPCPHDEECPLAAPDWCHFNRRLQRSRAHKHLKAAELPFEDERFSYVALTRTKSTMSFARILARPIAGKAAITARICTDHGVENAIAPRRDRAAYRRFRKLDWGDAIFAENDPNAE